MSDTLYTQGTKGVDNKSNRSSSGRINDLSENHKKELRAFVERTGRAPTIEEMSDITGRNFSSEQDKLSAHNFIQEEFGDEVGIKDTTSQYYQDPRKIYDAMRGKESAEGTSEDALYQMALQQRQGQLQQQDQQLGLAERDMQMQLSENRQQLMNDIRNRRRSLLKSGLSSAQVANEEVQSLLQRQQQAAQVAEQYYGQRQQTQTQMANAPQDSAQRAYEMAQGLSQTGAQYAAAGASDPIELAKQYSNQTNTNFKNSLNKMTLDNNQ